MASMTPGDIKDWLTSLAILLGGAWAIWRFAHTEWLRRRAEIPSLEGGFATPELFKLNDGRVVVTLRWTWRNVGTRPVYLDGGRCVVQIYQITNKIDGFVDPRQQNERLKDAQVGSHYPLKNFEFYMLEPGTTSSMLTVPVLPRGEAFIARHKIVAEIGRHPTGRNWNYSWEKWQVFRTDIATDSCSSGTGARTVTLDDHHRGKAAGK